MTVAVIVLSILLVISIGVSVFLYLFYKTLKKQYDILRDMESFEDALLLRIMAICETVVYDLNKFFSESLIAGIPEIQALVSYVRKIRDMYRNEINEYNVYNEHKNRIIVQEFLGEKNDEKESN